jgi:ABC-2 type transport system ATP-binding protein
MCIDKIVIRTNNLTKNFGSRIAVKSLNIEIKHGEIFSLLGRNGAGKTTTIKMLCCLLQPTSGNASVMNLSIKEDPLKIKEIIGVSPQDTAIAGHLNTYENLLLMGGVFGLKMIESKRRAKNLMELMELEDRKDQTRKLSGGLQRKLSIAMALMSDPQVLFLDEPTLGLDPHARKSVWNYIEKFKKGKTILLTTHYLEEADSLADHIAIMDEGKIIEIGTSSELKKRYSSDQTLKISAENITKEVVDILNKQGMEVNITSSGVEIKSKELDFYYIIDLLRQKKVKISGIQMQEPTLDDVFLHLTGKEAAI